MIEQEQIIYEEVAVEDKGLFQRAMLFGNTYLLVAKWCLYLAAFLVPIFFFPFTAAPLFAKEVLVSVLFGIALIGWLAHFLVTGRIAYKKSRLNVVLLALLAVTAISAFRSQSFFASVWGPDVNGEKLVSLVAFLAAYFLASVLLSKKEIANVIGWVYGSLLLAGIFSLLQMFHWYLFSFDFSRRPDFNTIGTVNALTVFYGLFFVIGVGLLIHMRQIVAEVQWKKTFSRIVFLATVVLFANILLISMPRITAVGGLTIISKFQAVWFGIGFAMMVFLGQSFRNAYRGRSEGGSRVSMHFGVAYYLPLLMLIFSALFYFVQTPFFGGVLGDVPVEVAPALSATIDIAKQVVKASPFFGSGPGTFSFDYDMYRSADINQTPFWSVKFFHGFSFVSTILATSGVLGFLAWFVFLITALFILFKTLFRGPVFDSVNFSIFGGICFSFLMLALYASNFTTLLFMFLLLGLFAARSSADDGEDGWVFIPRSIGVASPAFMFISSLVAIFLMVLSVVGIYVMAQKYVAEAYYSSGIKVFNMSGNVDDAEGRFARSLAIDATNDNYLRAEGQMRLVKMQQAVNQALRGNQNVQAEFQSNFSSARDVIVAATKVNPREPQNWALLGILYENLIPFIAGADQLAVSSYRESTKQDPMNPGVFLDLGRTLLESADAVQVRLNQVSDKGEASRLAAQRADYLSQAEEVLGRAISLKADYAPAHFLLAQTFTRKNDLASAIRKTEDTKALSPFDVGVAFQLGFLYYQAGTLDKAQAEFDRAVSLNANYSNARYFLGLIYDRQGNKTSALDQFQKIEVLNPDNQEVKRIIQNLQAGRPALSGIVPPAPAPEKRGTVPVGETKSNVVTPK